MKRNTLTILIVALITSFVAVSLPLRTYASSVVLKKGMDGANVEILQDELRRLGFFNLDPTGYYGDITEIAVINFQNTYGLYADGIAGPQTLSKLKELVYNRIIKEDTQGEDVESLQAGLKHLGYFSGPVTGYFGPITKTAVINFQKNYGLAADGIAGVNTLSKIRDLLVGASSASSTSSVNIISRSNTNSSEYKLSWYGVVDRLFAVGTTATVYDIESGLSFRIKRTFGTGHADCEALTQNDTNIMKKILGGEWSWERRAIVIEVAGRVIAASMNAMPHAGLDKYSEGSYINGRSSGYGYGFNYDSIKGNGMDGHFCVHFSGSRLHVNNEICQIHQAAVEKAYKWMIENK